MQRPFILTIEDKILLKKFGLQYNSKYNKSTGVLSFKSAFDGKFIPFADEKCSQFLSDNYEIEIDFSNANNLLPTVYNTDNRILDYSKLHNIETADLHLQADGSMCLCHSLEKKSYLKSNGQPDLYEFIILIFQFLYSHSYYEKNKREPWKGYSHGIFGNIEYLASLDNFSLEVALLSLNGDKKVLFGILANPNVPNIKYQGKLLKRNKRFVNSYKKVRSVLLSR